jgi:molybdenum cofactor cytidylyltransferase
MKVNHCGILLLAAGKSERLGSPKQLLVYKGKTLLRHAVDTAIATGLRPVIVVLGANSSLFEKELNAIKGIEVVVNEMWQEGMASSIHCGLEAAMNNDSSIDGTIIMVCDQPFADPELLKKLLKTQYETGKPIVASRYNEHIGVPAFFHKSYFEQLLQLNGDSGARKIIKENSTDVATIEFTKGMIDIDTKEDYENLRRTTKSVHDQRQL